MSQPNVVEALREIIDLTKYDAMGERKASRIYETARDALAALSPGPCVVVPEYLIGNILIALRRNCTWRQSQKDELAAELVSLCLTAQMPQGER